MSIGFDCVKMHSFIIFQWECIFFFQTWSKMAWEWRELSLIENFSDVTSLWCQDVWGNYDRVLIKCIVSRFMLRMVLDSLPYTLQKFWWYNKASLGELVPLEILGKFARFGVKQVQREIMRVVSSGKCMASLSVCRVFVKTKICPLYLNVLQCISFSFALFIMFLSIVISVISV